MRIKVETRKSLWDEYVNRIAWKLSTRKKQNGGKGIGGKKF